MKSHSSNVSCDFHCQCLWEKKYNLKLGELKDLETKLDEIYLKYSNRVSSLEKEIKALSLKEYDNKMKEEKLLNKKLKIKYLKEQIENYEKDVSLLQATIDFSNGKITNLRKTRQQSLETISILEAEIQKTKSLCQTPTKPKHKKVRKSIPSNFEIKTQIFPFEINEVSESKKNELEKIIEIQSKLLQEEQQRSKNLNNRNELLQTDKLSLELLVEELSSKLLENELRLKETKENLVKDFATKIESLKNENSELKFKLNEYDEKDVSTSDCDFPNELASLDCIFRPNRIEDESSISCKCCERNAKTNQILEKKIEKLEKSLAIFTRENFFLREDVERRARAAIELNKILKENQKFFETYQKRFNVSEIQREVVRLNLEKEKILHEIKVKREDLNTLNESIIYMKVKDKRKFVNNTIQESPNEDYKVLKVMNKSVYPEDNKKRRNIGSWCGNNFQGFNNI